MLHCQEAGRDDDGQCLMENKGGKMYAAVKPSFTPKFSSIDLFFIRSIYSDFNFMEYHTLLE